MSIRDLPRIERHQGGLREELYRQEFFADNEAVDEAVGGFAAGFYEHVEQDVAAKYGNIDYGTTVLVESSPCMMRPVPLERTCQTRFEFSWGFTLHRLVPLGKVMTAHEGLTPALAGVLPPHKGELSITHNEHKSYYDTVEQWAERSSFEWISDSERETAIKADEAWVLRWYPDTPVGFIAVAASSLSSLLEYVADSKGRRYE